jgi:hypothetical protein
MSPLDTHAPAATLLTLARPLPDEGSSSAIEPVRRIAGSRAADASLATRLATAPGLVRTGAARWDDGRTPIHPLSLESAYADPALLRDLGARGARFARALGVDVVVGAETAGVPLAAAVSLAAGCRSPSSASPGTAATRSTNRPSAAPTSRAGAYCSSTTPSPAAAPSSASPPPWPARAPRSSACSSSSTCATWRPR